MPSAKSKAKLHLSRGFGCRRPKGLQMEISLEVVHVTTSTFSLAVSFGDLRPVFPMPRGAQDNAV